MGKSVKRLPHFFYLSFVTSFNRGSLFAVSFALSLFFTLKVLVLYTDTTAICGKVAKADVVGYSFYMTNLKQLLLVSRSRAKWDGDRL